MNDVLRAVIGDYMHKLYFDSHEDENKYRELWGMEAKQPIEKNQVNIQVIDTNEFVMTKENKQLMQDYIMRDLFIWAILMNRVEMAKVFLCHVKYRVCAALIATQIFKSYYSRAAYGESKDNYLKSASYFEDYAVECINQCEENNPNQSCQIVIQQIELFGNVTPLQVASHAGDKLFVASSCSVQAMNNIWYDKMHPTYMATRSMIGTLIGVFSLGLLAPFTVPYRKAAEVTIFLSI